MTRKQRQIRIEAGDGTVQDYLHRIWARLFWTNALLLVLMGVVWVALS